MSHDIKGSGGDVNISMIGFGKNLMIWREYTKGNICLIVLAVENKSNMAEYLKWHIEKTLATS